jgi:hypothetical protein
MVCILPDDGVGGGSRSCRGRREKNSPATVRVTAAPTLNRRRDKSLPSPVLGPPQFPPPVLPQSPALGISRLPPSGISESSACSEGGGAQSVDSREGGKKIQNFLGEGNPVLGAGRMTARNRNASSGPCKSAGVEIEDAGRELPRPACLTKQSNFASRVRLQICPGRMYTPAKIRLPRSELRLRANKRRSSLFSVFQSVLWPLLSRHFPADSILVYSTYVQHKNSVKLSH